MVVFQAKHQGTDEQYQALDEAIRTARFVANAVLRYWIDDRGVNQYDFNKSPTVVAGNPEFIGVKKLNSRSRIACFKKAGRAICKFFENCKNNSLKKKKFPHFRQEKTHGSVEYETSGWSLSENPEFITFANRLKAGTFKCWRTRNWHCDRLKPIERVRVVRIAEGDYVTGATQQKPREIHKPENRRVGIDFFGRNYIYTDRDGNRFDRPQFLRRDRKALKREQPRLSPTQKDSKNPAQAQHQISRKSLKFSKGVVRKGVKNYPFAESISELPGSPFIQGLEHFGKGFGIPVIAVPPALTFAECFSYDPIVKKALSDRTHQCPQCAHVQNRD